MATTDPAVHLVGELRRFLGIVEGQPVVPPTPGSINAARRTVARLEDVLAAQRLGVGV